MGWGKSWDKVIKPMVEQAKTVWGHDPSAVWPSLEVNNLKDPEKMYCDPDKTEPKVEWPNSDSVDAMNELLNDQAKLKLAGDLIFIKTTIENGEVKAEVIPAEQVYANLAPTHDPYTNPGAFVYYECNCGAILDPKTKSFAGLNNAAMNAGWKIRWKQSGEGYQPFCSKCGEGVE